MKRYVLVSLVLCSFLAFAGSAWSLTTTDVGATDTLLSSIALANSGNAEQAWLESLFPGETIVITNTTAVNWTQVDGLTNTFAFNLSDDPANFFVKIGTGNTGSNIDHFLFQNNANTGWAVIALSDLNVNNINHFDVGRISHIGEIGTSKVPEPGMLILFGSGLLGLGIFGRKKFGK